MHSHEIHNGFIHEIDNGFVEIQIQKGVDQWRTYTTTTNNPGFISMSMMEASQMNPEYRVRAIDSSGRLLDML